MPSGIPELLAEYQRNREDAAAVVADLDQRQFTWRPAPGAWSIGECLAHLNAVNGMDLPLLEQALAKARQEGWRSSSALRYGPVEGWFVRTMEPPPKRRFPAPAQYLPPAETPLAETMAEFERILGALEKLLAGAEGLDLRRAKMTMPALKFLKMSAGARFALIAAHTRRHLCQARQVRERADFPVAGGTGGDNRPAP